MPLNRVLTAGLAALGLVPALLTVGSGQVAHAAATPPAPYSATITRTTHGIPHIVAKDFGSLGFGAGYAAAGTSICTLADTVLTARGQRSRYLGPDGKYDDQVSMVGTNLQVDTLVGDLHDRRVVEKLLASQAGPGQQARDMVAGYAAGVNAWLRSVGGAKGITDPTCKGAAYIAPNATAEDIWYGVYLANLIASTGHFLPQITEATPPSPTDPGVPQLPVNASFQQPPKQLPSKAKLMAALGKDPHSPFGSNATAIGGADSTTGRGMLLGNPHFPWRGRYRFTEQQLTIPGSYDVAGASLIGSPVVNIGWNKDVAWSHTVSTAYRFTPYEYQSLGTSLTGTTTYLTSSGPKQLEKRSVKVTVKNSSGGLSTVTKNLYRTDQGYVARRPGHVDELDPHQLLRDPRRQR